MHSRRVAILFNPVSGAGRGETQAQGVARVLLGRGHSVELVPTRREPAMEWMPQVVEGADAAVVVGGDGAMRIAAGIAARVGVPLYHCRAGTENLVARHFGAGHDPALVAAAIERLEIRRIDLGQFRIAPAGDHSTAEPSLPFLIMASVGFDAEVVHSLAPSRRGAISHVSYLRPIAEALVEWRPARVRLAVDDAPSEDLGHGVLVIANIPDYGFRIDPGRGARADDGVLDAAFLPCHGGWGAARWALVHLLRRGAVPGVRRLRGTSFRVDLDRPVLWQLDGDPAVELNLPVASAHIGILPSAVPIVMPVRST